MKYSVLLLLIISITACNNNQSQPAANPSKLSISDSSIVRQINNGFDTLGLYLAPIKILEYSFKDKLIDTFDEKDDNLNHEGHFKRYVYVNLKYKNVSSKKIVGLKLKWYFVDKNGNPSDMRRCDSCASGVGEGYTGTLSNYPNPEKIKIGEIQMNEWFQPTQTGVKIKLIGPTEVEFYDKTKWRLGK